MMDAHHSAVTAVEVVLEHVCLAAGAGAGDGPVVGDACFVAVCAEAGVVGLAVSAQIAWLCTALRPQQGAVSEWDQKLGSAMDVL